MGSLLRTRGDFEAAIRMLEPALGLCREAELWASFPRIASALGTSLGRAGRSAEGVLILEEAVPSHTGPATCTTTRGFCVTSGPFTCSPVTRTPPGIWPPMRWLCRTLKPLAGARPRR